MNEYAWFQLLYQIIFPVLIGVVFVIVMFWPKKNNKN